MDVGVAHQVTAHHDEVQLLVVGDLEIVHGFAVRSRDHERELALRVSGKFVAGEHQRVAVAVDGQAGRLGLLGRGRWCARCWCVLVVVVPGRFLVVPLVGPDRRADDGTAADGHRQGDGEGGQFGGSAGERPGLVVVRAHPAIIPTLAIIPRGGIV
jgi:hypothetical protein